MDSSNGYEAISSDFVRMRSVGIGVPEVQAWARTLPSGGSVLDLGCGPGVPLTSTLVDEGLKAFGVDAAPSLVDAFRRNLPGTPILCEEVQTSRLFERSFDAVLAWGLIFLLSPQDQHRLIQRFAEVLVPNGHLLFTAPRKPADWKDVMTGLESTSLGAEEYRTLLDQAGISVLRQYEDEGGNHYFDAMKTS